MMDSRHTIHISRGNVTVEVQGSQEFVEQQFNKLESTYLDGGISTTERRNFKDATQTTKGLTLSELYTHASIPYKRDAVLIVGYYLEMYENHENFTKSEVEERAMQAKIELGKNLSRDLGTLIEKGHLAEVGEQNGETTYYLTRSGESRVEEDFGVGEVTDP